MPAPVVRYLEILEQCAKHEAGTVPEEVLEDAWEHLTEDWTALQNSEPGLSDDQCYQHFVQQFGEPAQVAKTYADAATPVRGIVPGTAPGWRICCTRCGRSAPASRAGITRIGARSTHKYVGGWCRECRRLRWLRLERDLNRSNLVAALGADKAADDFRREHHRPWLTIAIILGIVIACLSVTRWMFEAVARVVMLFD